MAGFDRGLAIPVHGHLSHQSKCPHIDLQVECDVQACFHENRSHFKEKLENPHFSPEG